jgi:periplasmic divalent cation tolerance protein
MKEILVLVTCRDKSQGRRIGETLVREKLAACVNVLPGATSIYVWEGKLERSREAVLLVKSRAQALRRLTKRIHQLHSYSVPEVIAVPIVGGSGAYLRWVRGSVR